MRCDFLLRGPGRSGALHPLRRACAGPERELVFPPAALEPLEIPAEKGGMEK